MKTLATQRENTKRCTNDRDSQTMTSPREGSIDQPDMSPVNLLGSASDPEPYALDELEHALKRQRTGPSFNHQGDLDMRSISTGVLSPTRRHPEFRQSLKSHARQTKKLKRLQSIDPPSNHAGGSTGTSRTAVFSRQGSSATPYLQNNGNANPLQDELWADRPVDVHHGTQAQPIELSDGDPFSQGNEVGDFLLGKMPEPGDMLDTLDESQLDPETQVTLSDAAFESQSSHYSDPNIKAMRLQQRKEAYKAAKEPSGFWEVDHGLVSSNAHHGEEEVEL